MKHFVCLLLATCLSVAAFATIPPTNGVVTTESGEPLPGVNVVVKGTTTGTVTNANGQFSLPELPDGSVVTFHFVGFENYECPAGQNLKIVLFEETTALTEIMVTTQKRQQTPIEVPTAISAISGEDIQLMNVNQMDQMADYIPGLQVQIQSPNNPGYVIRGVTSDDGASYATPRISVFMDEVSISRSRGSVVELFDLERVEVAKGPQGTLFGRGAEIGAIHFLRKRPTNNFEAEIGLKYGSYNELGINGMLNTPIVKEKLANRFAFTYDAHDGYIENMIGDDLNGKKALAFRNSTRLYMGETWIADLILDFQHDDYPGTSFKSNIIPPVDANGNVGDTHFATAAALSHINHDLGIKRNVGGATLHIKGNLGKSLLNELSFSSITGYRGFFSDEYFDADGSYLPLLNCEEEEQGTQFSQEFRINLDKGDKFHGFVGASYFYEDSYQYVSTITDLQYLYPAMVGNIFGSTIKSQLGSITSALPSQYATMLESYLNQAFPESYDITQPVSSTPDIYGDLDAMMQQYVGASLDATLYNVFLQRVAQQQVLPAVLAQMGITEEIYAALPAEQQQQIQAVVMQQAQAAAGEQITSQVGTITATLQGISAIPLGRWGEQSTNYATNHAAEIYADASFKLAGGLSLALGLRGSYEKQTTEYLADCVAHPVFGTILYTPTVDADGNYVTLSKTKDYWSCVGRAALYYLFGRNNAYLSVSRGRRPGVISFNTTSLEEISLDPEIIWSYEAGIKGFALKNHLAYDFSVYYYDWSNFQTTRLSQEESASGALNYVADDAGKAHSFGIEAGLRYSPIKPLVIFGNYAYIDGKFNDEDDNGNPQEYAGNRFRLTPEHSFSLGIDYLQPLSKKMNLFVRPSYAYKSEVQFDDDNDPLLTQEGYGTLNFFAGVQFMPGKLGVDVGVYGKNILDEEYLVDAGNSGRTIGLPTFVAGAPSTFGAQIKVKF